MPENKISDEDGKDAHGDYRKVTPTDVAHCESCGRQTDVVIIRDPGTGDETWYGLCCDAQGDDLPNPERFPYGQ